MDAFPNLSVNRTVGKRLTRSADLYAAIPPPTPSNNSRPVRDIGKTSNAS